MKAFNLQLAFTSLVEKKLNSMEDDEEIKEDVRQKEVRK